MAHKLSYHRRAPSAAEFRPPLRPKRVAYGSAGLRSGRNPKENNINTTKGDTSIELRKGTFLKSFDIHLFFSYFLP